MHVFTNLAIKLLKIKRKWIQKYCSAVLQSDHHFFLPITCSAVTVIHELLLAVTDNPDSLILNKLSIVLFNHFLFCHQADS